MAKNVESTAVNELIELAQAGKPLEDPGEELFGTRPPARVQQPRVTATIPPMRGAGEVAPLPRRRSANGTERNGVPTVPPPVRVTPAPPPRATTIPPIVTAPKGTPAPTIMRPPPPPARAPSRASLPPPARTSAPPSAPVAAPFQAKPSEPHPFTAVPVAKAPVPAAPIVPVQAPRPPVDLPGDKVSADNWFEASRAVDKIDITFDDVEKWPNTSRVEIKKRGAFVARAKKLALPVAGLAFVGVFVGGYFAFNGEGRTKPVPAKTAETAAAPARVAAAVPEKPSPAPTPTPTPAPTPTPTPTPTPAAVAAPATTSTAVHEVPAPNGAVKLVDVRVDSTPSGATVMLVDNGKTTFLGTTPVSASLDPARAYDVVVTLEGHPTQMAHVDPAKLQHVSVALDKGATKAIAATPHETPAPAPKKEAPAPKKVAAAPAPKKEAPVKKEAPAPKKVAAEKPAPAPTPRKAPEKKVAAMAPSDDAATGNGTLAIASKPPCEITIDGKSTGLVTPQRSISLSPGAHKILLVNQEQKIKKQFAVAITANQATKVIKDFLKQ
jgi:hypothetical protein